MSSTILDRTIVIAQHELNAMRQGNIDDAALLFKERGELIDQAMHIKDEKNIDDYRRKLIALQGYQQIIHEEGTIILNQIRASLMQSKSIGKVAKRYRSNQ